MSCGYAAARPIPPGFHRYLFFLAQHHMTFRVPELRSVARLFGIELSFEDADHSVNSALLIVDVRGGDAAVKRLLERCVLIRHAFRLWCYGDSWEACLAQLSTPRVVELMAPFVAEDTRFKIEAETFGKRAGSKHRQRVFDRLSCLPLRGRVDLKQPDLVVCLAEDYGADPKYVPEEPYQVALGHLVARSQRNELMRRYDLKSRAMVGNTSMDTELSLIMANLAMAGPGRLVFDPFVGTASLLTSCAAFGAHVAGADINFQVIHGIGRTSRAHTGSKMRGPRENIRATFEQYGQTHLLLDCLVADSSSPCLRDTPTPLFDAIVSDPPYGIREGAKKIGDGKAGSDSAAKPVPDELRDTHIPRSEQYALGRVYCDLVAFAMRYLVVGGRLVFWMPCETHEMPSVPHHPRMRRIACSRQLLSGKLSRWLVTMEKVEEAAEGDQVAYGPREGWEVRTAYLAKSLGAHRPIPDEATMILPPPDTATTATESATAAAAAAAAAAAGAEQW